MIGEVFKGNALPVEKEKRMANFECEDDPLIDDEFLTCRAEDGNNWPGKGKKGPKLRIFPKLESGAGLVHAFVRKCGP